MLPPNQLLFFLFRFCAVFFRSLSLAINFEGSTFTVSLSYWSLQSSGDFLE